MEKDIETAVKVLKTGGIVVFPTDTAFGIGCRVDDNRAVARLFQIRNRPPDMATPVLVDTVKMAQDLLQPIPQEVVDQLIEPYWPGALTIVLQSRIDKVPELVRGGGATLGVRIPDHRVARRIIRGVGVGVLGPSANFHEGKTPYLFEDLDRKLTNLVDFVLPGECTLKQASTVIDCSAKPWRVLRQGAVRIMEKKNNIILCIDTSSNKEIIVKLDLGGTKDELRREIGQQKAQVVLPMIDEILGKHHLTIRDISEIRVGTGPGSFTGLRVGISIANAIVYALRIPVNGKIVGEFVDVSYP